jgi:CHASE1-domain containing sensor protein
VVGRRASVSEPWIPVLAAILGLLGGVGGAAVGGFVANEGQERRFEHERATETRDRRMETYVKFVRAVEDEHFNAPTTDDRLIRTAEAEVALVASGPAVRQAASRLVEYALFGDVNDEQEYARRANEFLGVAHAEIEAIE